jgi:hypothetical protein
MTEFLVMHSYNGEDSANGIAMHYRRKGVVKDLARDLSESLGYKACLEPADGIVFITFDM